MTPDPSVKKIKSILDLLMPFCAWCRTKKPDDAFHFNRLANRWNSWCKLCSNEKRREARASDPGKTKDSDRRKNLMKRYGITPERYNEMLAEQGGTCALCPVTTGDAKHYGCLVVDHCHSTGRVRGLLCQACNLFIGSTRLTPEYLAKMADYLSEPNTEANPSGK